MSLNTKELLLLSAGSVATAILLPFIVVPLLTGMAAPKKDTQTYAAATQSDSDLVEQCRNHIAEVTNTQATDLRVDQRSTGYRDARYNVHGFVRQNGEEFDFQCWFKADRTFDTHFIGRVSLEAISRQRALGNGSPF
jgi:hypothetical protein